jgi:hypothetical protein
LPDAQRQQQSDLVATGSGSADVDAFVNQAASHATLSAILNGCSLNTLIDYPRVQRSNHE